jgi:hypothetical protein
MMARSWIVLHPEAAYMTASGFDRRRDHSFVADFREESIYALLASINHGSTMPMVV